MKSNARRVQCFVILVPALWAAMISAAPAQTLNFELLHTFTGVPDGGNPSAHFFGYVARVGSVAGREGQPFWHDNVWGPNLRPCNTG